MNNDNIDDVLNDIYSVEATNRFKEGKRLAYEERIVKKLMTMLGLEAEIKSLVYEVKQLTGKPGLSFAFFKSKYPSFPYDLVIKQIPYVYQTGIADLFDFKKSKIGKAWGDLDNDPMVNTALIFDFPGIKGTQLVCHEVPHEYEDETLFHISGGPYIEQFEIFVKRILTKWTPG